MCVIFGYTKRTSFQYFALNKSAKIYQLSNKTKSMTFSIISINLLYAINFLKLTFIFKRIKSSNLLRLPVRCWVLRNIFFDCQVMVYPPHCTKVIKTHIKQKYSISRSEPAMLVLKTTCFNTSNFKTNLLQFVHDRSISYILLRKNRRIWIKQCSRHSMFFTWTSPFLSG